MEFPPQIRFFDFRLLALIASFASALLTFGIFSSSELTRVGLIIPYAFIIVFFLSITARSALFLWMCLLPLLFLKTNVVGYFAWASLLPLFYTISSDGRGTSKPIPIREHAHILSIIGFATVGTYLSNFSNLAIEKLIGTYFIPAVIYFSIQRIPFEFNIEERLPKLYLLLFAFIGFGSVIYKLQNPSDDRVAGYFQLSVTMIGYCSAALLPISLYFVHKSKNQLMDTTVLILILLAMLLTNTRFAIPMAGLSLLINFRKFKKILVPLAVIAGVISIIGYKVFFYRYFVLSSTTVDTSLIARLIAWKAAIHLIHENLFFGIGLTNFSHVYQQISRFTVIDLAHSHNMFFQKSLDIGVPGMIVYFSFIYARIRAGFKLMRDDLTMALALCLSIYLIAGLLDSVFYMTEWTCFYWSLLGCLARRTRAISSSLQVQ